MALKKCRECGQPVSTKADNCPHCGASQSYYDSITWPLFVLLAGAAAFLLMGCETSAVWYETHPDKVTVDIDGHPVSVVPRRENKFDAWGGLDGTKTNMAEVKLRHISAVEKATGCEVTGAEYMPSSSMLNTTVRCGE